MNAQYLVLILVKCWMFNEFIAKSVAISQVKSNLLKKGKTYVRPNARSYLYLNYKETYGLRFDPEKFHKKRQSNDSSNDDQSTWSDVPILMPSSSTRPPEVSVTAYETTVASNGMQTLSVSTEHVPNLTTIASPSSSDVSITTPSTTTTSSTQGTTIDNRVSSTESTRTNNQQVLAFSSLLNWNKATKRQNTTMTERPKPSSLLKETLQLIRKRIKQWLSLGTDSKASLINGQRFLNVFNVIKFENGPCTSTQEGLTEMSGICYQDFQCTQMGGSSIDECADGLGVCCVCMAFYVII